MSERASEAGATAPLDPIAALEQAGRWFREYEEIHARKARHSGVLPMESAEAERKAARNRERAEFCERAALSGRAASEPVAWRIDYECGHHRLTDDFRVLQSYEGGRCTRPGCSADYVSHTPLVPLGAPEGQASGCDPDRCEWWRRFNSGYYAEPVAPADGREGENGAMIGCAKTPCICGFCEASRG